VSEPREDLLHDLNTQFIVKFGMPESRRATVGKATLSWWQSEGGATRCEPECGEETDFNPFNSTLVFNGSHVAPGHDVPVQVYRSRSDGIAATVATLSASRYAAIRHAIVTPRVHALTICKAIAASDWGTSLHPMVDVLADITKRGLWHEYADIPVYPS